MCEHSYNYSRSIDMTGRVVGIGIPEPGDIDKDIDIDIDDGIISNDAVIAIAEGQQKTQDGIVTSSKTRSKSLTPDKFLLTVSVSVIDSKNIIKDAGGDSDDGTHRTSLASSRASIATHGENHDDGDNDNDNDNDDVVIEEDDDDKIMTAAAAELHIDVEDPLTTSSSSSSKSVVVARRRPLEESSNIDRRRLRFSTITVREHRRILGDNVTVMGPPISISWEYEVEQVYDLDEYEVACEDTRRTQAELKIPSKHRDEMLKTCGYTRKEIQEAIKRSNIARGQRKRTIETLKLQPLQEAFEKILKAGSKPLRRKSKRDKDADHFMKLRKSQLYKTNGLSV